MSTFLGPIHYWLFNKIKLVEDREKTLSERFKEKYGDEIEAITEKVVSRYGPHLGDTPLDQLIGDAPIHGFLAQTIETVETREAALLCELINKYGEEAKALALEVAHNHGSSNGRKARKEYDLEGKDAKNLYNILRNYFLDGMPCDHVVEIETPSEGELIEKHTDCLHRSYWQNAGISEEFMCRYLGRWIDGFVEGVGAEGHSRNKTLVNGDPYCEDIFKA